MSRNASGTYTLPVSAYVSGTVIRSADMNSNLSDIATALTQSLATTGVSSMTGPVKLANGSSGAPSLTFAGETTTGFYWSAAGTVNYVVAGTTVFTLSAAGATIGTGLTLTTSVLSVSTTSTFTGTATFSGTPGAIITTEDYTLSAVDPAAPSANRLRYYTKADPLANGNRPYAIDSNGTTMPLLFQGGQCRMTLSGTKLVLTPYMGNRLTINGVPQIIPDAGISLAASNTAATFVYIYAYMNSGTMTLEMSTTVPTAQTGTCIQQKTGDPTRTLVGAAYTDTGGAWADTEGKLWVLSYFNRKPKTSRYAPGGGTYTFATATISTEISANFRNQFITWGDEYVTANGVINAYCSGALAQTVYMITRLDNTASNYTNSVLQSYQSNVAEAITIPMVVPTTTENANHNVSLYCISSAQAIQVFANAPGNTTQTYTTVTVMG